jgi:integrase
MHDKSMTKSGTTPRKTGPGIIRVKHGSAVVSIYSGMVQGQLRYTLSFHLNGQRVRRTFSSLQKAKVEAQGIAKRIQEGKAETNDLNVAQREAYKASQQILAPLNMPLLPAVEEYAQCRQMLGEVPILVAVQEFLRRTKGTTLGKKVPDIAAEMIEAKQQDGLSAVYVGQLKTASGRFAKAFPGEIMSISSGEIDRWLRKLGGSPVTRNSVHRCIKVLFSFAKARGYLPGAEQTAAEMLPLAKEGDVETEIFTSEQIRRILVACPAHVLGYVALGAFAGLRVAEICRLNWSSVDLDRRIIMLRADQAKTASRRIVPIADNLAAWLSHINRSGPVTQGTKTGVEVSAIAKKLGIRWPHNALRHSYISYRIAEVKDAARVALEAGNSAEIIFKHYRELVTEQEAQEWFSILPPQDWSPPPSKVQRRKRR